MGLTPQAPAPYARWRRQAVSYGRPAPDPNAQELEAPRRDEEGRADFRLLEERQDARQRLDET
jgi:hypothetical protein